MKSKCLIFPRKIKLNAPKCSVCYFLLVNVYLMLENVIDTSNIQSFEHNNYTYIQTIDVVNLAKTDS